jgi:hypothetical protein
MVARDLACSAVLVCVAMTAPLHAEPRAVIELFTSQGCSSCPAADKLLGEFAADPTILAMSLAIDYWDYLGWKDTLALAGHAKRQRAYAHSRHDRQVYTPQAVINGATHTLGSDRGAIERAIVETRKTPGLLSVPVTLSAESDAFVVRVGGGGDRGEIWLCPLSKAVSVAIGRGENSGRTITYHNVVRQWIKVGEFAGSGETWNVPRAKVTAPDVDAVAVVVQRGAATSPGPMLGGAIAEIR